MKKLITFLLITLFGINLVNATGVTPDQPINTFVYRSLAIPKTINSTSFSTISELTVEITPACNGAFGAGAAKAQLCAEFTNTNGDNIGEAKLLINTVKKTGSIFITSDSFSDKGTQCYTFIIGGTNFSCGTANIITTQVRGNLAFQKASLIVDYKN